MIAVARGYLGYGLPHADLIQEGNIGLMKAVKRFDPERGVRLVSFAMHWIKAEIHEYILKNWRLVKIATTKAQRKLFFNLRSMKQSFATLGPDEVDAVAQKLGVKPEEVVEMETRLTGRRYRTGADRRRRRGALRADRLSGGRQQRRALGAARAQAVRPPAGRRPAHRAGQRSTTAAAPSSSAAGWSRTARKPRRCMNWPPNTAFRPSASARSKPRRCRR